MIVFAVGISLMIVLWKSVKKIRDELAGLDDDVLQNHAEVNIFQGYFKFIGPIFFLTVEAFNCPVSRITPTFDLREGTAAVCTGIVIPCNVMGANLAGIFIYNACFGPFIKRSAREIFMLELNKNELTQLVLFFVNFLQVSERAR